MERDRGRRAERRYLTTGELARLLDLDARTVRRAVRKGRLVPAHRTPGGHARFERGAAERLRAA